MPKKDRTGKLTGAQKNANWYLRRGFNVFLTGPAGTGKTHSINMFKSWCQDHNKKFAVTSTTGSSALLTGGRTIHSWAGIRYGDEDVDILIQNIRQDPKVLRRWRTTQILIIDEISMLSAEIFEKLNAIGQDIRYNTKPFGGMQIVLSGDFAQLPPVKSTRKCFNSPIWKSTIDVTIYFRKIVRQDDRKFQKLLCNVRLGILTPKHEKMLMDRVGQDLITTTTINGIPIKPTRLHSHKANVNSINETELQRCKAAGNLQEHRYHAEYKYINTISRSVSDKLQQLLRDNIDKNCPAESELVLVKGVQVMLTKNIWIEDGLANGSRGVVVDFQRSIDEPDDSKLYPVVEFLNGIVRTVVPDKWEYIFEEAPEGKISVEKYQVPLLLAFATTIHKSQGMTIDLTEQDLSRCFDYGQAYTALSRVRDLSGLSLTNFSKKSIKADPEVVEYYSNLSTLNKHFVDRK